MKIPSVYPDLGYTAEINIVFTSSDFTSFSDFTKEYSRISHIFSLCISSTINLQRPIAVAYSQYSNTGKWQQTLLGNIKI